MLTVRFRDDDGDVVEGDAPADHAVVEMRVRKADCLDSSPFLYCRDCTVVEQADAVVKDIAAAVSEATDAR